MGKTSKRKERRTVRDKVLSVKITEKGRKLLSNLHNPETREETIKELGFDGDGAKVLQQIESFSEISSLKDMCAQILNNPEYREEFLKSAKEDGVDVTELDIDDITKFVEQNAEDIIHAKNNTAPFN